MCRCWASAHVTTLHTTIGCQFGTCCTPKIRPCTCIRRTIVKRYEVEMRVGARPGTAKRRRTKLEMQRWYDSGDRRLVKKCPKCGLIMSRNTIHALCEAVLETGTRRRTKLEMQRAYDSGDRKSVKKWASVGKPISYQKRKSKRCGHLMRTNLVWCVGKAHDALVKRQYIGCCRCVEGSRDVGKRVYRVRTLPKSWQRTPQQQIHVPPLRTFI